ncbi:uncharacterized protein LOC143028150 [Oratosquilla oratoria]|uniref:uncharacterized protein LOC143028150 n=1 Tax=Oratosquilla oratoria TaxID=337810 RepID=UPI003F7727A5
MPVPNSPHAVVSTEGSEEGGRGSHRGSTWKEREEEGPVGTKEGESETLSFPGAVCPAEDHRHEAPKEVAQARSFANGMEQGTFQAQNMEQGTRQRVYGTDQEPQDPEALTSPELEEPLAPHTSATEHRFPQTAYRKEQCPSRSYDDAELGGTSSGEEVTGTRRQGTRPSEEGEEAMHPTEQEPEHGEDSPAAHLQVMEEDRLVLAAAEEDGEEENGRGRGGGRSDEEERRVQKDENIVEVDCHEEGEYGGGRSGGGGAREQTEGGEGICASGDDGDDEGGGGGGGDGGGGGGGGESSCSPPSDLPLVPETGFQPPAKNCFRLVVLGSAKVGKTSIVSRFLNNKFEEAYTPTIEDFHRKLYRIRGSIYQLDLLDTSGSHPFPAMRRLSFLTGDLFLLVFAVDSRRSWEELLVLRRQILETKAAAASSATFKRKRASCPRVPMVVAANKCDREDSREVSAGELAAVVSTWGGCAYLETSARKNQNVDKLFYELFVLANLPMEMSPALHKRLHPGAHLAPNRQRGLSIRRRLSEAYGIVAPNVRRPSIRTDLMILRAKTSLHLMGMENHHRKKKTRREVSCTIQ